jgi:hypothetical protein
VNFKLELQRSLIVERLLARINGVSDNVGSRRRLLSTATIQYEGPLPGMMEQYHSDNGTLEHTSGTAFAP